MKALVVVVVTGLWAPAVFAETWRSERAPVPPLASLERMHEHGLWGAMGPTPASNRGEAPAPTAPRPAPPTPPDGPGGPPGHADMHRMHHGPDLSKGARFTFERAGTRIEVKCDDDEPMRACVEAAIMLIDKLSVPGPAAPAQR